MTTESKKDMREFRLPESKHDEKPLMVDFNKAAKELGCDKVMLTKSEMPRMIEWVRAQQK